MEEERKIENKKEKNRRKLRWIDREEVWYKGRDKGEKVDEKEEEQVGGKYIADEVNKIRKKWREESWNEEDE